MPYITMQHSSRCAILVAVLCWPLNVAAETVTLAELEALAVASQDEWVRARVAQGRAEGQAARAGRRPTISLDTGGWVAPGGDFFRVQTIDGAEVTVRAAPPIGDTDAFRPNIRYEATLAVRAPLYDFGQTKAAVLAADAALAAARAEGRASRSAIVASVRAHYIAWLEAWSLRGLAQQSFEEAKAQSQRVAARVQAGDRRKSDLDEATHELLAAELSLVDADDRTTAAKRELSRVVGQSLSKDAEPDVATFELEAKHREGTGRDEVEALEKRSDVAKLSAKRTRRTRAPRLDAVFTSGINGQNRDVFPGYRAGLTFNLQLWDGGRAAAEAKRLEAYAAELGAEARELAYALSETRRRARGEHAHASRQLRLVRRLVTVSERRVAHANAGYELGAGSLDAIAEARAALRDAKSRVIRYQVERARAAMQLSE